MWFRPVRPTVDELQIEAIGNAWWRATEGAGFVRTVATVTGPTIVRPKIVHIRLGPPTVLTVALEPGQTVADLRGLAPRIAPFLGAWGLRVEALDHGRHAKVTLLDADPLADPWPLPEVLPPGRVLLGIDEQADPIALAPPDLGHAVVQGQTRSGKSGLLYAVLAQLGTLRGLAPPVRVDGIDPSGLLLRPFPGSVLGLADPAAVEAYLRGVVDDMDRRIRAMPPDVDVAPVTARHPLRFVILEEYPGLLRALDALDAKRGKTVRALVARLLAEGHKAGLRVWLVAQRAEANLIGAGERGQCALRISLRVDGLDAVRLLHPDVDPAAAAAHATAEPGIALLSAPGRPLSRMRVPWIGSYAAYVASIGPVGPLRAVPA